MIYPNNRDSRWEAVLKIDIPEFHVGLMVEDLMRWRTFWSLKKCPRRSGCLWWLSDFEAEWLHGGSKPNSPEIDKENRKLVHGRN